MVLSSLAYPSPPRRGDDPIQAKILSFKETLVLQIKMSVLPLDCARDWEVWLGTQQQFKALFCFCHLRPTLLLRSSPPGLPHSSLSTPMHPLYGYLITPF